MSSLRRAADELVKGTISIEDGCLLARDAIVGQKRSVAGLPSRVVRSIGEVQRDVADLAAYIASFSIADSEKWAGTLLMLHVQLALTDINAAIRLGKSVIQVSRGQCPSNAQRFAVAIVDSVLANPDDLTMLETELFRSSRKSFSHSRTGLRRPRSEQ